MRNCSLSTMAALAAVLNFTSASDCAGQVFVDDFDGLNDDSWTHYNPLGGGSFEFPDGAYKLSTTAPANASYGPARVGSTASGVTIPDFRVSVDLLDWDDTLPQTFGIIARTNDIGPGTSTGYLFSYSPGASAGRSHTALAIERLDNEQIADGGAVFYLPGGDLTPGTGYRMVFTGIGDQFSGRIYALSDLDSALGSVSFTDDTYQTGGFGLLVADSNTSDLQGATATFDNFSVTAVPEPADAAWFAGLFGAVVLGFGRWRASTGRQVDSDQRLG